jgi:hypothetical protein
VKTKLAVKAARKSIATDGLSLSIPPATLARLRKASNGASDGQLRGWLDDIMESIVGHMETIRDADPGVELGRTVQVSPMAWVTVSVPRREATYLSSRHAALIVEYGNYVARFVDEVETAAQKKREGRYVKPGYSPASVRACGDYRGRRDLVPLRFVIEGWKWRCLQAAAERIRVKPSLLIRVALWKRYRSLVESDEREREARRIQDQIANPAKGTASRPAGANPLRQKICDGKSLFLRGVACRQVVFEMPRLMLQDLREFWEKQGIPKAGPEWAKHPARRSVLVGQPTPGHPRDTFNKPSHGVPSRKTLLQTVMKEMLSGPSERVSIFIPEAIWQMIVARAERFGITPAEDCASSIAYHVALHRKSKEQVRPNPFTAFERKLKKEARDAKAAAAFKNEA